ncbi:MAG: pyridoxal-phosphate dependent enzyme, partial [Candidatus Limnocylindria bacterium]
MAPVHRRAGMTAVVSPPGVGSVAAAAALIAPYIERTPLVRSEAFSTLTGSEVFLKLEDLQVTGAFKLRGALHKLLRMDPAVRARGVLTASAGNHGQGVAHAARLLG